jgi:hypothetical protein
VEVLYEITKVNSFQKTFSVEMEVHKLVTRPQQLWATLRSLGNKLSSGSLEKAKGVAA